MTWKVSFEDRARKELRRLHPGQQERITAFLRERIATAEHPRHLGEPLAGTLSGLWRYRVGDYRLLCRIEDARLVVLVVAVGHRREVYR